MDALEDTFRREAAAVPAVLLSISSVVAAFWSVSISSSCAGEAVPIPTKPALAGCLLEQ